MNPERNSSEDGPFESDTPDLYDSVRTLIRLVERFQSADWSFVANALVDALSRLRKYKEEPRSGSLQGQAVELSRLGNELSAISSLPKPNLSDEQFRDFNEVIVQASQAVRCEEERIANRRVGDNDLPNAVSEITKRDRADCRTSHSRDFASVCWYGTSYEFKTCLQRECVRLLWEAWKNGTPSLSEKTIGDDAGSDSNSFQLAKVFREKKKKGRGYVAHPAWNTMIQRVGKGTFRLVCPAKEN